MGTYIDASKGLIDSINGLNNAVQMERGLNLQHAKDTDSARDSLIKDYQKEKEFKTKQDLANKKSAAAKAKLDKENKLFNMRMEDEAVDGLPGGDPNTTSLDNRSKATKKLVDNFSLGLEDTDLASFRANHPNARNITQGQFDHLVNVNNLHNQYLNTITANGNEINNLSYENGKLQKDVQENIKKIYEYSSSYKKLSEMNVKSGTLNIKDINGNDIEVTPQNKNMYMKQLKAGMSALSQKTRSLDFKINENLNKVEGINKKNDALNTIIGNDNESNLKMLKAIYNSGYKVDSKTLTDQLSAKLSEQYRDTYGIDKNKPLSAHVANLIRKRAISTVSDFVKSNKETHAKVVGSEVKYNKNKADKQFRVIKTKLDSATAQLSSLNRSIDKLNGNDNLTDEQKIELRKYKVTRKRLRQEVSSYKKQISSI